jgi:hypothetical protein
LPVSTAARYGMTKAWEAPKGALALRDQNGKIFSVARSAV